MADLQLSAPRPTPSWIAASPAVKPRLASSTEARSRRIVTDLRTKLRGGSGSRMMRQMPAGKPKRRPKPTQRGTKSQTLVRFSFRAACRRRRLEHQGQVQQTVVRDSPLADPTPIVVFSIRG